MAFVTLEDASGLIELVLFPDEYARFGGLFSRLGPYRVRGHVDDKRGFLLVEASDAMLEDKTTA
jgi:DNA polymerase III alpha subunit